MRTVGKPAAYDARRSLRETDLIGELQGLVPRIDHPDMSSNGAFEPDWVVLITEFIVQLRGRRRGVGIFGQWRSVPPASHQLCRDPLLRQIGADLLRRL